MLRRLGFGEAKAAEVVAGAAVAVAADATTPPLVHWCLALLALVVALLLLLLQETRKLAAAFALVSVAEDRRERQAAEEKRLKTIESIRLSHDSHDAHLSKVAVASAQLTGAIDKLERLAADAKWTEAGELLARCEEAVMATFATAKAPTVSAEVQAAASRLREAIAPGGSLCKVHARSETCRRALVDLTTDADWTLSSHKDGTRVQFRRSETALAIKVDALIDGVRPADALYVWRETSLYHKWFPMVTSSTELLAINEADSLLHLEMDNWVAYNDMAMNGWGCDCLSKDGYILLVVRPITQADVPAGVTVPERKKLRRLLPSARVEAVIDVLVEPLSASSVRFAYSLTIPLASTVPAWAVNFILSEACANIFSNMREQAKKMAAQSPDSAHLKQAQTAEGRVLTAWLDARIDPYVAVLSGRA